MIVVAWVEQRWIGSHVGRWEQESTIEHVHGDAEAMSDDQAASCSCERNPQVL